MEGGEGGWRRGWREEETFSPAAAAAAAAAVVGGTLNYQWNEQLYIQLATLGSNKLTLYK